MPLGLVSFALFGQLLLPAVILLMLGGGLYLLMTAGQGAWHMAAAFKLGLPMILGGLLALWTVLRVKPAESPQVIITRDTDMPLWRVMDEMSDRLEAPRVDRIGFSPDFNASASRPARLIPRPWKPAPYEVTIGVPLLLLLNEEELRAVLAHELAHHSHRHTTLSLMVWRALANAEAVLEALDSESLGVPGWLLERFYAWYAPRLHRMALPYSRRHELEADATAASLVGRETMAQALGAVAGRAAVHHRAMRQLKRMVDLGEPLPDNPLTTMLTRLPQDPAMQARISVWIQRAMRQETDDDDTHPCLRERLAALGFSKVPTEAACVPDRPALAPLLGKSLAGRIMAAVDGMVVAALKSMAEEATVRRRDLEFRVEKLNIRIRAEGLTGVLASELMAALLELERHEAVIEVATHLQKTGRRMEPLHAFQAFVARLHMGEERALVSLLELAGRHPWLAQAIVEVAREWLDDDGAVHDTPELRRALARLEAVDERCQTAMRSLDRKTMEVISPDNIALPEEVEEIRQLLEKRRDGVRSAWLVARRCRQAPGWVQLTLVVEPRWTGLLSTAKARQLKKIAMLAELSASLPHPSRAAGGLLPWDHPHMTHALRRQIRRKGIRLV